MIASSMVPESSAPSCERYFRLLLLQVFEQRSSCRYLALDLSAHVSGSPHPRR